METKAAHQKYSASFRGQNHREPVEGEPPDEPMYGDDT